MFIAFATYAYNWWSKIPRIISTSIFYLVKKIVLNSNPTAKISIYLQR